MSEEIWTKFRLVKQETRITKKDTIPQDTMKKQVLSLTDIPYEGLEDEVVAFSAKRITGDFKFEYFLLSQEGKSIWPSVTPVEKTDCIGPNFCCVRIVKYRDHKFGKTIKGRTCLEGLPCETKGQNYGTCSNNQCNRRKCTNKNHDKCYSNQYCSTKDFCNARKGKGGFCSLGDGRECWTRNCVKNKTRSKFSSVGASLFGSKWALKKTGKCAGFPTPAK